MRFAQNPYIIADIQTESMNTLFNPKDKIPVKLMPKGTQYQVGEIAAFYDKEGNLVVHRLENYLVGQNGKLYYVTEGTNNPSVDEDLVCEDDIIGIADLSEEAYARVQELYDKGMIPVVEAYAKPQIKLDYWIYNKPISKVSIETFLKNAIDKQQNQIQDIIESNIETEISRNTKTAKELMEIHDLRGENYWYGLVYIMEIKVDLEGNIIPKNSRPYYIGITIIRLFPIKSIISSNIVQH